jgi:signal transduction histidine kinase
MEAQADGSGAPRIVRRLRRVIGWRRSLASRLLLGFFLAFLIPGTVFVFLLERRVSELGENAVQQLAAVRLAQASLQLEEDAGVRADAMDRRAGVLEEAAWLLARAAALDLQAPLPPGAVLPPADAEGHVWTSTPEGDTMAFLRVDRVHDPDARRFFLASRALAPLMQDLRERRRSVAGIGLWTAAGAVRLSPWIELHKAIRVSGGALERFSFNEYARFPARRPPSGDVAVWKSAGSEGPRIGEQKYVSLLVPVRDGDGNLIGGLALDIDLRGLVADALERGQRAGDVWFAVDPAGSVISMTSGAAQMLGWRSGGGRILGESPDPEQQRLARTIRASGQSNGKYRLAGRVARLASVRVRSTGWVFVEGLSADAIARIESGAAEDIRPRSFTDLKGYLIFVFGYLALAVLAVVVLITRRISAPVSELVRAAEEIGRGRAVEISSGGGDDEIGRLGAAIDRMGKRVERRVETLRRLHALFRAAYRTTDLEEVLARASEGIAAFTHAERVWFFLYDPDTNRLEAGWPGWNMTRELANELKLSVESRSISALVFKSGEPYVTNDIAHDPYVNRKFQALVGAENAVLCPLKEEDKTLGVVVATNRPGGFGHEEVDAVMTFADAASLLIKNVRLYSTLTRTVEELRRASRLKDHFLQNVNHELRTPLTSIVGWTDLLEEPALEEKTLRRGIKQVRQSARVLLALIDDLLDLARMDRGTLSLELKPVALGEVLQRSLETVRLMAETRGVALILAPLPDQMPPIRADPLRLQQVLWNVLANAIKFTPRHGRVILRVEQEPERYLVSVEDDGIGIPEGDLPHIFERFRQVDGSPTRRHPGMGIGLALARSLVELHGGAIWAESRVGEGSRFTFSLPMSAAERRGATGSAVTVAEEIES